MNEEIPIQLKHAIQALCKYLLRIYTKNGTPKYDATLTVSSIGIQLPLFFMKSYNDDLNADILTPKIMNYNLPTHVYQQSQNLTVVVEIAEEHHDYITPEHAEELGLALNTVNLVLQNANSLEQGDILPLSASMPLIQDKTPMSYNMANNSAIFRVLLEIVMHWAVEVDFETPTKVFTNMLIKSISTKPVPQTLPGNDNITIKFEQAQSPDIEIFNEQT